MNWNFLGSSAEDLTNNLGTFVRRAWPVLHPGAKLSWCWFHELICEHLMLLKQRRIRRLLVCVPPRTSKSTIVSVCFPVWAWIQNPELSFLCASHEMDLSTTFNLERRRLVQSSWFQNLFANRFQLSTDRNQVDEFGNDRGGASIAVSTGSRAQGRGGDIVLLDDPISANDAFSDITRKGVNDWLQYQLPQRLNNPAESPICVVMQRLHEGDPAGFLLETEGSEWTVLRLPLLAEEPERWIFPVSGRVVERRINECLDPRRFPPRVVQQRQRNRYVWASQFQQRPSPIEGNLIRRDDIRFYGDGRDPQTGQRDAACPEKFDLKIISVDASFKDKVTSDFVCVLVVAIKDSRRYVLNCINAHLDLDGTEREILRQHAMHGPISATLIEDKANGSACISHMQEKVSGTIAVNPEGGKLSRMMAASPEFQANNWYLDRTAAWCEPLIEQLCLFPAARNDDMCDAVSQASIWLQAQNYVYGFNDYMRELFTGKRPMDPPKSETFAFRKEAALKIEAHMRGLKSVNNPRWEEEIPPPCPSCGAASCIVKICDFWRCGACGTQFRESAGATTVEGRPLTWNEIQCPECGSTLLQSIPGGQRCGQCGKQSNVAYPRGASRADVVAGKYAGAMTRSNQRPARGFLESLARITYGGPKR